MDKNELKKELFKTKVMAEFSHYCAGNLYYTVQTADGGYQFPIRTIGTLHEVDNKTAMAIDPNCELYEVAELSKDLGTTAFNAQERASMLWRWIDKAIDGGEFVKLGIPPPPEPPKDRIIREGEEPPHPRS
jgi:hypothetical protein